MPVLADFGPEAYARVVAQLDAFAARLGVPREIIRQYWNDTAHLPQTIGELEAWGARPDREYGQIRRDPTTGAWTALATGPTPGKTPEQRGGFPHFITNQVGEAQRFQQVDPQGNIFTGSWDPEYNRAHFDAQGNPIAPAAGAAPAGRTAQGATAQVASVGNPYAGTPYEAAWEAANPSGTPFGAGTATPTATGGGGVTAQTAGGAALPGARERGIVADATAYGNTQELQARIDDAIRRYALARNAEEREQAFLDLQRWQTELKKVQSDQARYDAMATALLSASTQLSSQPRDYYRFNQYTSGGRGIFGQMQQAGPAFSGTTGPVEPGSVDDLLRRLGIGPSPATPATPAGVQPGAANPSLPGLPAIPVPGSAGVPGALQPGATGGAGGTGAAQTSAIPPHEVRLRELDQAAGGSWSGNRADPAATANAWWNASPQRRGTPMPTWT